VPLLLLATATGWARIHVNVHFPLDIAAGLLLATVVVGALATAQWFLHAVMARTGRAPGDEHKPSVLWRPS
jgi:undecaprenyl-diphosphatase